MSSDAFAASPACELYPIQLKCKKPNNYALFATRDIAVGETVLIDMTRLAVSVDIYDRTMENAVKKLEEEAKYDRREKLRIDPAIPLWTTMSPRAANPSKSPQFAKTAEMCSRSIEKGTPRGKLYLMWLSSFINHSCRPNTISHVSTVDANQYIPVDQRSKEYKDEVVCNRIIALRDIRAGDEITSSYLQGLSENTVLRQHELKKHCHFTCKCMACKQHMPIYETSGSLLLAKRSMCVVCTAYTFNSSSLKACGPCGRDKCVQEYKRTHAGQSFRPLLQGEEHTITQMKDNLHARISLQRPKGGGASEFERMMYFHNHERMEKLAAWLVESLAREAFIESVVSAGPASTADLAVLAAFVASQAPAASRITGQRRQREPSPPRTVPVAWEGEPGNSRQRINGPERIASDSHPAAWGHISYFPENGFDSHIQSNREYGFQLQDP